jgi:membrane protein DedA with SNARE-associated domain
MTALYTLFTQGSYLAIVFFLVICGFGVPVPEEIPVVLAGVLASQGTLEFWPAWLACVIGAIGGDSVMYAIGYFWGHGWFAKHPRFAKLLHADREAWFEEAISRHSFKVLFLARFMVGIRAPVYLAAGIVRIPYLRFLAMDAFCATVVVTLFFSLAYKYGEPIIHWIRNAEVTLTIGALLGASAIVSYVYWRYSRRVTQKLKSAAEGPSPEPPIATDATADANQNGATGVSEKKRVG